MPAPTACHRRCILATLLGAAVLAGADVRAPAEVAWDDGDDQRSIALMRTALAASPDDAELASQLGFRLGLAGALDEGLDLLARAAAREPDNPDHELRRAIVLREAGRRDEALAAAERAVALSPAYDDAVRARDGLRQTTAASAAPDAPPRWRLDAGGLMDRYSAVRDVENEVFATAAYSIQPQVAVVAGVNQQHRYGFDDQRYDLAVYAPLGGGVGGWVRLGVCPGNQFLPDREYELGAEVPLPARWQLGARAVHRSYPAEEITSPRPSLRWDPLPWLGVEIAHTWAISDSEPTTRTAEGRLHLAAGERWGGYIGYSQGEENNPPLPIGEVRTLSLGARWQATDRLGFRLDASREDREDLYRRTGVGLSTTVRF